MNETDSTVTAFSFFAAEDVAAVKRKGGDGMKRNVDLNEISDGRLYSANDMVKVECGDCAGCSACCQNMGTSVVLDPMDIWKMQRGTGRTLEKLLKKELELNVVDGIILPNLRMNGTREVCSFLNEEGRCSIHPYRPGICRLFPLGRYYEKNGFHYFLQIDECRKKSRGKMKVKKWLGIENLKTYETYMSRWHEFLNKSEDGMKELDEQNQKVLTLLILQRFYQTPFQAKEDEEFYREFFERLSSVNEILGF